MADLLDITEDYLIFDNLITVVYTPFSTPRTPVTIENVKRYPATQVPASVGGTSVPTVGTKFCIFFSVGILLLHFGHGYVLLRGMDLPYFLVRRRKFYVIYEYYCLSVRPQASCYQLWVDIFYI